MSWLYSRALVEAFWEENFSDGEQSAPLNMTNMPEMFLWRGKTTDASRLSQYGMTCERLTDIPGAELLTWYLEGFPVKTFHLLAEKTGKAYTERNPGYGQKWHVSLARYDCDSCSWRIPQCSFVEGLDVFSETWPRWGMMRDGECFRLLTLEHDTGVKDYGLLDVIGTPIKTQRSRSDLFVRPAMNPFELCPKRCLPSPEWVEELMGWPMQWTALSALETDKFRKWLDLHGSI